MPLGRVIEGERLVLDEDEDHERGDPPGRAWGRGARFDEWSNTGGEVGRGGGTVHRHGDVGVRRAGPFGERHRHARVFGAEEQQEVGICAVVECVEVFVPRCAQPVLFYGAQAQENEEEEGQDGGEGADDGAASRSPHLPAQSKRLSTEARAEEDAANEQKIHLLHFGSSGRAHL